MSTLETNSIGKYSGNNVSVDDALRLKSYDTDGRDALTSVAGDMIYNTTTNRPQYYDGSDWQSMYNIPDLIVSYLVIAGGGSGGSPWYGGGGGAGGYRNSYASETSGRGSSTESTLTLTKSTSYTVTVGGAGSNSAFSTITSLAGGNGQSENTAGSNGGSGVVILRWATADATIGATRTGLTDGGVQTDGSDSYIVFTAGTGTISFS